MIPAFLITVREVLEAALIVATIVGVLTRLKLYSLRSTVWFATASAVVSSFALLLGGSLLGLNVQAFFDGPYEPLFEGVMMIISAIFITWAVFWLHRYFGRYKIKWLQKVHSTVESENRMSLFILVYTACVREGVEIVLFLGTIFFSSKPLDIFAGVSMGVVVATVLSALVLTTTIRMNVFRAFQMTTLLLVLFAGGMLLRGVEELHEAHVLPQFSKVSVYFMPQSQSFAAEIVESLFGWSRNMESSQLIVYAVYLVLMRQYLIQRTKTSPLASHTR